MTAEALNIVGPVAGINIIYQTEEKRPQVICGHKCENAIETDREERSTRL
jgi:hypothetical protein